MLSEYQRLMRQWHQEEPAVAREPAAPQIGNELAAAFASYVAELAAELIATIHAHDPAFFEELVIDVLLAMGYGGRRRDLARRLGRSGDGGVDGLISMDELGLDQIYLQAKRMKPGTIVPVGEVRDFAGSLDAQHAVKGIFVTTGNFSPPAVAFSAQVSRRVALVDGVRFAELMIRYNVGVRVQESYQFKRLDADYFRLRARTPAAPR